MKISQSNRIMDKPNKWMMSFDKTTKSMTTTTREKRALFPLWIEYESNWICIWSSTKRNDGTEEENDIKSWSARKYIINFDLSLWALNKWIILYLYCECRIWINWLMKLNADFFFLLLIVLYSWPTSFSYFVPILLSISYLSHFCSV